ncbi:hypothetical protein [Modicisalibacter coralii]|uniref:hypothetical protein n=1 Tax=Modicisalibacter coralii TaxID=2304602 RepID=UPI00100BE742|nr:hypothetical protein [Halomonas coralii]
MGVIENSTHESIHQFIERRLGLPGDGLCGGHEFSPELADGKATEGDREYKPDFTALGGKTPSFAGLGKHAEGFDNPRRESRQARLDRRHRHGGRFLDLGESGKQSGENR